jgi:hypothetical protein
MSPKSPSEDPGERVFVIAPLAAKPLPGNAHRYDELASGRMYVESDPIGLAGGDYSTYSYVHSIPVRAFDPNGLEGWVGCPDGSVAPYGACHGIDPPEPNSCPNKPETCKLLRKHAYFVPGAYGEAVALRNSGEWNSPIYRPIENFLYAQSYDDISTAAVVINQLIIKPYQWLRGQSTFPSLCALIAGIKGVSKQDWTPAQWKEWCGGDCGK